MSSESELIAIGRYALVIKYYTLATCTILFYDHLLTLADEIKYIWSRKKSWMFWLFVANRYFPMAYQFRLLALSYGPHFSMKVCDETAFIPIITLVCCTLFAQVVLTTRLYAVTMKNITIAVGLAVITTSQFAVGIYLLVLVVRGKAQPPPPIPLDAYRFCPLIQYTALEVTYTTISLFYDFLAFLLIIFFVIKSKASTLKIPSLLGIILEDATRYFLVIFTSHFVLEMTLTLGRESIQLLPATGTAVYLPVMISRLMLSLRKAADEQQGGWALGGLSVTDTTLQSGMLFQSLEDKTERDDGIPLEIFPGP